MEAGIANATASACWLDLLVGMHDWKTSSDVMNVAREFSEILYLKLRCGFFNPRSC